MNVELPGRACVHSSDCGSSLICDADAHLCLIPAGGSCQLTKHCAAEYFCDWHDKCDCPWLQQKFGDHCEHLRGSSWWAVASRFLTIVLYCPALFVASEGMLVECVRLLILWKQGTSEDSHWMALFSLGLNMLACLFNLIFAVIMVMDMLEVGSISKGLSEEMAFVFEGGALTCTLVVIIHMILLWIQLCLTTQTLQRDKFRAMRRFLICFITACVTARLCAHHTGPTTTCDRSERTPAAHVVSQNLHHPRVEGRGQLVLSERHRCARVPIGGLLCSEVQDAPHAQDLAGHHKGISFCRNAETHLASCVYTWSAAARMHFSSPPAPHPIPAFQAQGASIAPTLCACQRPR